MTPCNGPSYNRTGEEWDEQAGIGALVLGFVALVLGWAAAAASTHQAILKFFGVT